jgi:hypothetical protein
MLSLKASAATLLMAWSPENVLLMMVLAAVVILEMARPGLGQS